jgi:hypothetical protein
MTSHFVFSQQDLFQNVISVQSIPHKYNKQSNEKCLKEMSCKSQMLKVYLSLSTPWKHTGGSRGIAPIIPNLDRWLRWAVGPTTRPLHSRGKCALNAFNRKLDGSQSRSGLFGEEKYLLPLCNRNTHRPVRSLVTISSKFNGCHPVVFQHRGVCIYIYNTTKNG